MNRSDSEFLRYQKCQVFYALCNLALDEAEQLEYVKRHGGSLSGVEDLTLDLEIYLEPIDGGVWGRTHLTPSQLEAVTAVQRQLDEMYPRNRDNSHYNCSFDDLHLDGWERVRTLAREALSRLGFEWGPDIRERLSADWPPGHNFSW